MSNTSQQEAPDARSPLDWLLRRGPGAVLLRLYDQLMRLITGHPVYDYARITPQLYCGGQHRLHGWRSMQEEGITAVVNLRREHDDLDQGVASENYLYLPTRDNTPPSMDDLEKGVQFIDNQIEQGGKVYIHCGVGVGRAPSMAAAYLVSKGVPTSEAWRTIRQKRPFIWPNRSQRRQLERFAEQHSPDQIQE